MTREEDLKQYAHQLAEKIRWMRDWPGPGVTNKASYKLALTRAADLIDPEVT